MNTVPVEIVSALPTPAVTGNGQITVTGSVDRVRQYHGAAEQLGRAAVAMQVMAGFELAELRKLSPYRQGGRRGGKGPNSATLDQYRQDAGFDNWMTWEEFLAHGVGLSERTAGRYMAMAEAIRPRLKNLDGFGDLIREILEKPVSALTVEQTGLLTKAVNRIADGRTQLDFLEELGLLKKPGNPSLGGATAGGGRKALSADRIVEASREDWGVAERQLRGIGATFTVLADADIEAQIAYLDQLATARRRWIKTPAAKRNDALVDEIAATLR